MMRARGRDDSEEIRVAMEALASTPCWSPDAVGAPPLRGSPEWERALHALKRSVEGGRGIVVFDGPDGTGKSTGLRELMQRLPAAFRVVLLAGEALSCAELSGRVLDVLEVSRGENPQQLVALHAEHLCAQGRSLVLLVDDAEALPVETVHWLALLARSRETGVRVVLAVREYAVFLEALAGLGICVDLARLDPLAITRPTNGGGRVEPQRSEPAPAPPAPRSVTDAEPVLAPGRGPLEPVEPPLVEELAREPIAAPAVAAPPSEVQTEPPNAEREPDRFLTLEELLGTAEHPFFDPPEPDSEAGEAAGSHRVSGEPQSVSPARKPEAAAPPLLEPAYAAVSMHETPPTPESSVPGAGAGRRKALDLVLWSVAGAVAAGVIAWLAPPAFWGRPGPSSSTPPPVQPVHSRQVPVVVEPPRAAPAARRADPVSREAQAAGAVVVSDLRQAFELLGADPVGDSHVAAFDFLRRHGPDSEGYALLDELDARHPSDPEEAVELLAARSRVRATLCAAWADDARGEAPGRLGCPGAKSAPR
jgi:hypothetical protein